jgi:lysine-ketoglutarate reductase/saccharopine dehydrogenase-like protein (TIGR00300 family)
VQASETVELRGHLIDSGILSRVLKDVLEYGGEYTIDKFDVGRTPLDESSACLTIKAADHDEVSRLVMRLQTHGANLADPGEAVLREVERDGGLPDDFYSTTNLETVVRLGPKWVPVENPEMDCGIVIEDGRARTISVSDVRRGQQVVCGASGIKVVPLPAIDRSHGGFEFMNSDVSSEKPQALLVRQIAEQMREVKGAGKKILWVAGLPLSTRARRLRWWRWSRRATSTYCSRGNALATHDIEASLFGTSLGVDLKQGRGVEHGHEHHIRAINQIRKAGSIASAVEQGVLTGGIMHALVQHRKDYVLVGSVRDDGRCRTSIPTSSRTTRDASRPEGRRLRDDGGDDAAFGGYGQPPAGLDPTGVRRHQPRNRDEAGRPGSAQARGIVTDIGLFLEQLALELAPAYRQESVPATEVATVPTWRASGGLHEHPLRPVGTAGR